MGAPSTAAAITGIVLGSFSVFLVIGIVLIIAAIAGVAVSMGGRADIGGMSGYGY